MAAAISNMTPSWRLVAKQGGKVMFEGAPNADLLQSAELGDDGIRHAESQINMFLRPQRAEGERRQRAHRRGRLAARRFTRIGDSSA